MLKRSFILITTLFVAAQAHAFCGFYVAKGDTKIFNRASQVVIVRDQDRTVMTMANDFQGSARDFAVVIPVPTKIERGQIQRSSIISTRIRRRDWSSTSIPIRVRGRKRQWS